MMTYRQFHTGTDIRFCGRGKELKDLDERVKAAEANPSAANLIAVLTSAIGWGWRKQAKHGDKPSKNFSIRLQVVKQLVTEVEQDLSALGLDAMSLRKAALSYELKKTKGAKSGLRSLQKGYAYERKQFEAAKKGGVSKDTVVTPKAGSLVTEVLTAAGRVKKNPGPSDPSLKDLLDESSGARPDALKLLQRVQGKHIGQISPAQYEAIVEMVESGGMATGSTGTVNFVRKTDRVSKFLTWCEHGLFYKQDGVPYTSPSGHEIYAMDRYGNLITMPTGLFLSKGTRTYATQGDAQHNHSSLNAGADVICAGEIEFQNGKIIWIDNASGHYKPTARQLQNCVHSLSHADGADLSALKGHVWHKGPDWIPFDGAAQLLARQF